MDRISGAKLFHKGDPDTENALAPSVMRPTGGTRRWFVVEDHSDD